MRTRHGLVLAISLLALVAAAWLPRVAQASLKCQCNDGAIVESRDDDADCDDVCSGMGGGSVWTPRDEQGAQDDGGPITVRRRPDSGAVDPHAPDYLVP